MKTKKMILSGFFIAMGIIVPTIFHALNLAGPIFLPMHLPVILGGFLLGPAYGAAIGFITPIICGFLTGMPPVMPTMPIMALELCAYGFMAGFLYNKTNKIFISLVGSMIFGRIWAMVGAFILSVSLAPQISAIPYIIEAVTNGLPGILIQFMVIPALVKFMTTNKETSKVLGVN